MRRILLSLLALVVIAGLFAATGYAGYRLGYAQGAQGAPSAPNRDEIPRPGLRQFDHADPRGMHGRDFGFDRGFHRGFGMHGFPMMGFGFFHLLRFLVSIAVLALIGGFLYWLFARSGWQLTRTVPGPPAQPLETETNNSDDTPKD